MKIKRQAVRMKGKDIGEAEFPVYDSIEEAVKIEGRDLCLGAINSWIKKTTVDNFRLKTERNERKETKEEKYRRASALMTPADYQDIAEGKLTFDEAVERALANGSESEGQLTGDRGGDPDSGYSITSTGSTVESLKER